jgi:hypothetical protein
MLFRTGDLEAVLEQDEPLPEADLRSARMVRAGRGAAWLAR